MTGFFLLSSIGTASAGQHLVFSTFVDLEGKDPVIDSAERVMVEAYKRMGITMETKLFPGERALQTANAGQVDGELMRKDGLTKDFPNLIQISVPVTMVTFMVFTKKKDIKIDGWKSLAPYSVAYKRGVKAVEASLTPDTKSEPVATTEQAFMKLYIGRNDMVVTPTTTGLLICKQQGFQDVVMLGPPLLTIPLFHYIHVKNKDIVDSLTQTLQQMEKEGIIETINKQIVDEIAAMAFTPKAKSQ